MLITYKQLMINLIVREKKQLISCSVIKTGKGIEMTGISII